jgi:hypothetical protein
VGRIDSPIALLSFRERKVEDPLSLREREVGGGGGERERERESVIVREMVVNGSGLKN